MSRYDEAEPAPIALRDGPLPLVGALAASVLFGVLAAELPKVGAAVLGLALVVLALACATQWWGSLVVMAPVIFGVTITLLGLPTGLFMGLIVLPLALVWWATGAGSPQVSWPALGVAIVIFCSGVLLAIVRDADPALAVSGTLVWAAGVLVGTGWANNHRSLRVCLVVLSVLALFAVAELAGLQNPWMKFLGLDDFVSAQGERSLSTFGHPLVAGAVFTVAALLAAGIDWPKWSKWVVVSLLTAGAISTVSRSSLLALVAGLLVMFLINKGSRKTAVATLSVGLVTVLVLALGWLPALNESLEIRVLGRQESQSVRVFALEHVGDLVRQSPDSLIAGDGVGSAAEYLQEIGTVNGFVVFDNQYVTWIHEYGVLTLLLVGFLVTLGAMKASPRNRAIGLPAFSAVLVVIFFGDGMQWPAIGFIASCSLGFMCAPARADSG